jgi:hypothetical protein
MVVGPIIGLALLSILNMFLLISSISFGVLIGFQLLGYRLKGLGILNCIVPIKNWSPKGFFKLCLIYDMPWKYESDLSSFAFGYVDLQSATIKVEEKSSTTFSFSLSPGFLSFLREKFSPFLYGKFQKQEQNTFIFLFLRVFSVFSEKSFLSSPPP